MINWVDFMFDENKKDRVIQEYVPGKQITLAHIISKPNNVIYKKLGLTEDYKEAIGILTLTPAESTIIAADLCTKVSSCDLGFIDRFSGSVVIVGDVSSVESALNAVTSMFSNKLKFDVSEITRS